MYAFARVDPADLPTVQTAGLHNLASQAGDSSASDKIKQQYESATNRSWFKETPELSSFRPVFWDPQNLSEARIPANSVVVTIDPRTTHVYDSSLRRRGAPLQEGRAAWEASVRRLSDLVNDKAEAISRRDAGKRCPPEKARQSYVVENLPPPKEGKPIGASGGYIPEILFSESPISSRRFVDHANISQDLKEQWSEAEVRRAYTSHR